MSSEERTEKGSPGDIEEKIDKAMDEILDTPDDD